MSIKAAIIAKLKDNTPLTSLISDRVQFGIAAADDPLPRINISQIGADHEHHLTAASGHANGRFQFNCYGRTPDEADRVATALREALQGFRGKIGDTWISTAHLVDERDTLNEPIEGTDAEGSIDGVQQDYRIGWKTSIPTH